MVKEGDTIRHRGKDYEVTNTDTDSLELQVEAKRDPPFEERIQAWARGLNVGDFHTTTVGDWYDVALAFHDVIPRIKHGGNSGGNLPKDSRIIGMREPTRDHAVMIYFEDTSE